MTRITYLRNTDYAPVVCLAFIHERDDKTFKYQMAVHHPKDKCEKKVAVATATERLNTNPIELAIPTDLDGFDFNSATLCKIAMVRDIIARAKDVPKRAVKMAQMWEPN
jgi:hypothetical protein